MASPDSDIEEEANRCRLINQNALTKKQNKTKLEIKETNNQNIINEKINPL